jgi:hypothetical protein
MAYTDPSGNPCSGPHSSRKYCDIALLGLKAFAGFTKHTKTTADESHCNSQRRLVLPSREVFESFDNNLGPVLEGTLSRPVDIEIHPDRFDAMGRYS